VEKETMKIAINSMVAYQYFVSKHKMLLSKVNHKKFEIRNTKSETRNPKQIRNPKISMPETKTESRFPLSSMSFWSLGFFCFVFVSNFGFRYSEFWLSIPPHRGYCF